MAKQTGIRNSSGWYLAWENDFFQIDGRGSSVPNKEYRIKDKLTNKFITEERCNNFRFCIALCEIMTNMTEEKVEKIILGGENANDQQ